MATEKSSSLEGYGATFQGKPPYLITSWLAVYCKEAGTSCKSIYPTQNTQALKSFENTFVLEEHHPGVCVPVSECHIADITDFSMVNVTWKATLKCKHASDKQIRLNKLYIHTCIKLRHCTNCQSLHHVARITFGQMSLWIAIIDFLSAADQLGNN